MSFGSPWFERPGGSTSVLELVAGREKTRGEIQRKMLIGHNAQAVLDMASKEKRKNERKGPHLTLNKRPSNHADNQTQSSCRPLTVACRTLGQLEVHVNRRHHDESDPGTLSFTLRRRYGPQNLVRYCRFGLCPRPVTVTVPATRSQLPSRAISTAELDVN